jgi:hypothetical protein
MIGMKECGPLTDLVQRKKASRRIDDRQLRRFGGRDNFMQLPSAAKRLVKRARSHPFLLRCSGKEMIDNRKDGEERDADAKAPADELFLDRQERLGFDFAELVAKIRFRHGI